MREMLSVIRIDSEGSAAVMRRAGKKIKAISC